MVFVIVLVGCLNVGKFILFNCLIKLCDVIVVEYVGLICDCQYGEVCWQGCIYIVIDIGGIFGDEEGIDVKMVE